MFKTNTGSQEVPLGAAYNPILLSEVEQEQRLSGKGDRGAGLYDGEGVHEPDMPHIRRGKY